MTLEDIDKYKHFHQSEQIVKVLKNKNRSKEDLFFRVLVGYFFAKISSIMAVEIETPDRGNLHSNMYALLLATSGFGKGMSMNILEDKLIAKFKAKFLEDTMPTISKLNIEKLAMERASKFKMDYDSVLAQLEREYDSTGNYLFSFDSGTSSAVKQLRHQLLLSGIGSLNLEMDEVGANLSTNTEILNTFIELYDVGKLKPKITKNTSENKRNQDFDGRTPTNMLLFGTPSKLLDGSKGEDDFFSMLEMGYARRLLFAYVPKTTKDNTLTSEEIYKMMTDTTTDIMITAMSTHIESLADKSNYNKKLMMSKDVAIALIDYTKLCEDRSVLLKDHQDLEKAELNHRYFKATKLAGAYAFIDGASEVTIEHVQSAIKLVEESGNAFNKILKREKPYVKLAKYVADVETDVTQVDLVEDLPFYKGSESQKRDLLNLAIAYGYKHNIIIKKSYTDGIEFLRGEALKETDLSKMLVSYSEDFTYGYLNEIADFKDFTDLVKADGIHFTANQWKDIYDADGNNIGGHRTKENVIPGFNMVILDVDSGTTLKSVQELLQDYTYLIYTTKRHQVPPHGDRFRIILPTSHVCKLNPTDYSKFMENIFEWVPFEVDTATKDIARKWETNPTAEIYTNSGKLLDVMDFIPQTKKAEEMIAARQNISSMNNLEAWFYNSIGEGHRNNLLLRYAYILLENGYDLDSIRNAVLHFNSKLSKKLDEQEIYNTVMVTITKKYVEQGKA